MTIRFVDLPRQHAVIKREIDDAIARVVDSSHFILGEEVSAFEREFAASQRAAHCVAVANGTVALHLALIVAGVRPGDDVITVSHSFVATAEAIAHAGARPVFVDVDPDALTMEPAAVRAALTARTRAIVPVHLYGQMADLDPVLEVARTRGLAVIEDAAQAHGAEYKGRRAGELGTMACFSFFPSKNLGAFGDAGAVVTNDAELARRARMLANHGRESKYESTAPGFNYRLSALQAAVLRVKLRYLATWNEQRRSRAKVYDQHLGAVAKAACPREMDYARHVYHLYVIQTDARDALAAHLAARGIETGIHYPRAIHQQAAFRTSGGSVALPVTERAVARILSLPMFPELRDDEIQTVAAAIVEFEQS